LKRIKQANPRLRRKNYDLKQELKSYKNALNNLHYIMKLLLIEHGGSFEFSSERNQGINDKHLVTKKAETEGNHVIYLVGSDLNEN